MHDTSSSVYNAYLRILFIEVVGAPKIQVESHDKKQNSYVWMEIVDMSKQESFGIKILTLVRKFIKNARVNDKDCRRNSCMRAIPHGIIDYNSSCEHKKKVLELIKS